MTALWIAIVLLAAIVAGNWGALLHLQRRLDRMTYLTTGGFHQDGPTRASRWPPERGWDGLTGAENGGSSDYTKGHP